MKILLDENLPKRLKADLASVADAFTVRDIQWNGIKNGALLKLLVEHSFNALLTFDKNLQYQQNFLKYPITVFVLHAKSNQYEVLIELIPAVLNYLKKRDLPPGPVIIPEDRKI